MLSWSRFFALVCLLVIAYCSVSNGVAQSAVDSSFVANITKVPGGRVHKSLVQPDGKILVAGDFEVVNGVARSGLARLNSDGSPDLTFASTYYTNYSVTGTNILDIALQADGKVLVAGDFFEVNGLPKYRLIRLNTNGTIDDTFTPQPITAAVFDIEVLPDGKILVGGAFSYVTATGSKSRLVRLNGDGALDSAVDFSPAPTSDVYSILMQPGGSFVVASGFNLLRYTAAGALDGSFGPISGDNRINVVRQQADGKLLVGGHFTQVNGFNTKYFFRTNANGQVDGSFQNSAPDGHIASIQILPDQRVLIAGGFSNYNGVARRRAAIVSSEGVLDLTYNPSTNTFPLINSATYQSDGKVLLGGSTNPTDAIPISNPILLRTNSDGSIDSTFNPLLGLKGIGGRILVQPDGKIVAGGQFLNANGVTRVNLARFNTDGTLDTGFVPPPMFKDITITGVDIQPDGKLLVAGGWDTNTSVKVAWRLNTNGSLDGSLVSSSFPRDVRVQVNGQILLADGQFLRRFNSNLTGDATFNPLISGGHVFRIVLQPDQKILICGTFTSVNGIARVGIARLNSDGSTDTSFNPGAGANGKVSDAVVQADGKVIIGGEFTGFNFDLNRKYLTRLNSDGSLDGPYTTAVNAPVSALRLQADAKVLVGGDFTLINGTTRNRMARLNADGTTDASFTDGTNDTVFSFDIQSDGKIVYGGDFTTTNGVSTVGIGRLLNSTVPARTPFDFDGDGKADISVFRSSTSRWYEALSTGPIVEVQFGIAGDIVAPADFDGDGKTDEAIFRPSNGQWWYNRSIDGSQVLNVFGQDGDIPRPIDFDGDGKADLVLFRPSNSTWYRFGTFAGSVPNQAFGLPGDQPLVGDFDGDGKGDLAIFRPSNGDWWYAASSLAGAFRNVHWGQTGDIPVPADYDGDGKTDQAVYRPSQGGWYILNSSNGSFTTTAFGVAGDRPVAADYDGDGRADIAVFRPSTGIWYLLRSTSGFAGYQFGISTDTAIPGSLIP